MSYVNVTDLVRALPFGIGLSLFFVAASRTLPLLLRALFVGLGATMLFPFALEAGNRTNAGPTELLLAALGLLLAASIAFVVYVGERYERSRESAQRHLEELRTRTGALEQREQLLAAQERTVTARLEELESHLLAVDTKLRAETRRTVLFTRLDQSLHDQGFVGADDASRRSWQMALGLLRDFAQRSPGDNESLGFHTPELEVALDSLANVGASGYAAILSALQDHLAIWSDDPDAEGFARKLALRRRECLRTA